jgi:hypothetical protein
MNKKCISKPLERGSDNKKSIKGHYFSQEFFSGGLFRGALYSLMSVLHKDALLFHWHNDTHYNCTQRNG